MNKYEYDIIISLGDACFVNGALCKCDLQKITEKFPLDEMRGIMWDKCGRGGLSGKVDFICNGFRNFLNLEALEDRGIDEGTHKLWVVNKETGMSFRHDFSIGVPIKDEYPKVLKMYRGRIENMYKKINKSNRVLFLFMSQIDGYSDDYLIEQHGKLQSRFPKQSIEMLYVIQKEGLAPTEYIEKQLTEHVTRIDMDVKYTSKTDTLSIIVGNTDLYYQLLSRYSVVNKEEIVLHNRITRLKWNVSDLTHSTHQRLSRLEARATTLDSCWNKDARQTEIEESRRLLFAGSNMWRLKFRMYHFLIKKWIHIGEKRKKYARKYDKIRSFLRDSKKLMKRLAKEYNF